MKKRRLFWVAALILAAVLYLFENNPGTLTVLVGVLVLPILGLLTLVGRGIDLEIFTRPVQEKGTSLKGRLMVRNRSGLPRLRLRVVLLVRNLRTGEETRTPLEMGLLPRQKTEAPFTLFCPHCGRITLETAEVSLGDPFGLFYRKRNLNVQRAFTVLPELFACTVVLNHQDMDTLDSDWYSQTRPGSDPGEIFSLREYTPGDAIRRIHWKVSEKTDRLMVREFGLPVVNEVALLLDTTRVPSAEKADTVTEVFASLSAGLAEEGVHHRVFWLDDETDGLLEYDIAGEDDFARMLQALLELSPRQEGSVVESFERRYPQCPYAHVILVGGRADLEAGVLCDGSRVSILAPRTGSMAEGLQPDGSYLLTYDEKNYAADLCRVEV